MPAACSRLASQNGATPLHMAAQKGLAAVMDRLIAAGADVESRAQVPHARASTCARTGTIARTRARACTATHYTAFLSRAHLRIPCGPTDRLACARERASERLQDGSTPLLIASRNSHVEAVDRLIAAGGEINASDNVGASGP